MIEAPPGERQRLVVQEHHEIGQDRICVDAAGADLAHEIHAHRVAAEREESAVTERENAAITPDEIECDGEQREAEILTEQRDEIGRHVERRARRGRQCEHRHEDRDRDKQEYGDAGAPVDENEERAHASTALPLSANRPRGRFWIKRMMKTRSAILPSTAPANGSRNLLATPSVIAATSVPQRLPTPPNTTTMKLSMM